MSSNKCLEDILFLPVLFFIFFFLFYFFSTFSVREFSETTWVRNMKFSEVVQLSFLCGLKRAFRSCDLGGHVINKYVFWGFQALGRKPSNAASQFFICKVTMFAKYGPRKKTQKHPTKKSPNLTNPRATMALSPNRVFPEPLTGLVATTSR